MNILRKLTSGVLTIPLVLILAPQSVNATRISLKVGVSAKNFTPTCCSLPAPVDPFEMFFTVSFDNSSNIADTSAGLTVRNINIPLSSAIGYNYVKGNTGEFLTVGGLIGGVSSQGAINYDFFLVISSPSTKPFIPFVEYSHGNNLAFFLAEGNKVTGDFYNPEVLLPGETPNNPILPDTDTGKMDVNPITGTRIWIDPQLALGYDYKILTGDNLISSAVFPVLAGDTDGYMIHPLGDLSTILGIAFGGQTFSFASPVNGFSLTGISPTAGVDSNSPTAFVTGLTFANGNRVTMTQLPNSTLNTAVPEPATWSMMICGLGIVGASLRRRSAKVSFA